MTTADVTSTPWRLALAIADSDGRRYDDVVGCYREPLLEPLPAAGQRSFDGDGVELRATA